MNRRIFLSFATGMLAANQLGVNKMEAPEGFYFKDDGKIPNNKYPFLLYRDAFTQRGDKGAAWLEQKFLTNNWSNSWRNGIFSFHHYHSVTHEVLGIYSGSALVHMGGEQGTKLTIKAGDIIVIPAGLCHKNLESEKLGVVGAYPAGMIWDMKYGKPGERPQADENIAAVPFPDHDPVTGKNNGLLAIWK